MSAPKPFVFVLGGLAVLAVGTVGYFATRPGPEPPPAPCLGATAPAAAPA
jgi:hypothetical protein